MYGAPTWQNILFSDESKFNLKCSDGRVRIYRRRRKRFTDGCAKETDRFRGGGVMIWGGISQVGKTNLKIVVGNVNGIRYRYEILTPIVLPVIRAHHFNHVFQQDSARCHISRVAIKIRTLPSLHFKLNLDSSENKMFCQVFRLHRRCARAH
jgi:hypothetical protein